MKKIDITPIINAFNVLTKNLTPIQKNLVISIIVFIIIVLIYRNITREERAFRKRTKKHWIIKKRWDKANKKYPQNKKYNF